jgi:hypothetical protein
MIENIEFVRMEINYNRNKYIRMDKSVEEIAKIKINFYNYNSKDNIEDLELNGDENVIIYKNDYGYGDEFINIYNKVKIMITTEDTINEDKYKKLPENVEYVIVDNLIYEVKDEFEMMRFMSKERFNEYIEVERHGKINENNKNGETALTTACKKGMERVAMERVAMELIPKMSEEAINKWNKGGYTALIWACQNKMERVAMELIPRMSYEAINKWNNNFGNTALNLACSNKMERVAMELIPRMSEEAINKWNEYQEETALYWACVNNMERVAMELIPRMSEEAINKWNINGYTALYWTCFIDMEDVAIELIRRMSKKAINKWNNDGYTALYCACITKMERVIELINTINKK